MLWKLRYGRNKVLCGHTQVGGEKQETDKLIHTVHWVLSQTIWGYSWVRGLEGRHGDRVVCR